MAPRGGFLDLERHGVFFFYGDDGSFHYHQSDRVSVATYGIVFWPVFLVVALLLHIIAPSFPLVAATSGALYVAYCLLLDRAAQASSWPSAAGLPAEPTRPTTRAKVAAMQRIFTWK